jgi:hypothetical protein
MRRLIKAYTSFNRTERMGVLALCLIISILLVVRFTMHYLVQSVTDTTEEAKMIAAWNQPQTPEGVSVQTSENSQQNTTTGDNNQQQIATNDNNLAHEDNWEDNHFPNKTQQNTTTSPALSVFDPNTVDSITLRKLGLREKTTSIFLNWRRKGKRFYKKEELKGLYTLTTEEYNRLAPYITINNTLNARHYSYEDEYGPLPATININKADSITLIRLKGIGPVLAHRILQKRKKLNGFTSISQLLAVHHFSDSTARYLKQKLVIE